MQLSEILGWLARALPKQKMQDNGDGNVQAGRVDGDINHSHVVNNYTVQQISVDHNQLAIALIQAKASLVTPTAPESVFPREPEYQPVSVNGPPRRVRPYRAMPEHLRLRPPTPKQLELLDLRKCPSHKQVIDDFIDRNLRGKFIKELTDHEVYRATRYVEEAMWRMRVKEEVEGRSIWPDN